jgi:hypothetical protein
MNSCSWARVAITVLSLTSVAFGQNNPSTHSHISSTQAIIDGETNPELIPDSVAYRLYLLTIAPAANPTTDDTARQNSHIQVLRLHATDRQALLTVLADFKDIQI